MFALATVLMEISKISMQVETSAGGHANKSTWSLRNKYFSYVVHKVGATSISFCVIKNTIKDKAVVDLTAIRRPGSKDAPFVAVVEIISGNTTARENPILKVEREMMIPGPKKADGLGVMILQTIFLDLRLGTLNVLGNHITSTPGKAFDMS